MGTPRKRSAINCRKVASVVLSTVFSYHVYKYVRDFCRQCASKISASARADSDVVVRRCVASERSSWLFTRQCRQLICLIFVDQWFNHLINAAHQNFIQLVQRQVNAVIGDASLWEIVGADAFRTIA